jgi:hypothetical protein
VGIVQALILNVAGSLVASALARLVCGAALAIGALGLAGYLVG